MPLMPSGLPKNSALLFAAIVPLVLIQLLLVKSGIDYTPDESSFALRDTSIAAEYFKKGKMLSEKAEFDSSNFYYDKAKAIYDQLCEQVDMRILWEKKLQCYNNIGGNLTAKGKYDRALEQLTHALEIGLKKFGENDVEVAQSYKGIASVHWYRTEYGLAEKAYQKSLSIRLRLFGEEHPDVAKSYNNIGMAYCNMGKYDLALENHKKSLSIRLRLFGEEHPEAAKNYHQIGLVYWYKSNYDEALNNFRKSLAIRLKFLGEDHIDVARSYNNIGLIYYSKGNYDRALENYHKSLSIWLQLYGDEHPQVATCFNNIGLVHYEKGDYYRAIENYQKSLSIRLRLLGDDHPDLAQSYNNIGIAYWCIGDYESALENYEKALSIKVSAFGEEHQLVANTYGNMGIIYYEKGDYDRALEYHQKSLTIGLRTVGEENPLIVRAYQNIAAIYKEQEKYDKGIEYLQRSLTIGFKFLSPNHPEIADSYKNLAENYFLKNDYNKALSYCQKAMRSSVSDFDEESIYKNPTLNSVNSEVILLSTLALKARILSRLSQQTGQKDLEMALSTYQLITELIDQIRTGYKAEGSKLFLGKQASEILGEAIRTSLKFHYITNEEQYKEKAFLFVEKSKSAVLQAGLAEAEARQFARIPAILVNDEKQLRIDLAFYDTQIQKEKAKKEQSDSAKVLELESRLFDLKTRYRQFIADLEKNYPDYHALKYQIRPTTIPEIQSHLPENTILLEYFVGDNVIYIFSISAEEFDVVSVEINKNFGTLVDRFYRSLIKAETPQYVATAGELSALLIEPILSKIKPARKLIIIPHDILYKIPFEALFANSPKKGGKVDYGELDYLIKRFTISYHHSATLYLNSLKRLGGVLAEENQSNRFIGFAPVFRENDETGYTLASKDLPILSSGSKNWLPSVGVDGKNFSELEYSENEVRSIIGLFNQGNSKGYFYANATEGAFKKSIKDCGIVHIASHSFINEEHPRLSGVVFAQPTESTASEDGILYAGEVYNLDMDADLVVLSSCESGLGKLIRGEGMMALTRGFIYSGANNVIFSLWKVSDKHTSELMIEFYRQMVSGKTYAESLRQAKLKSIANPATSRPRSWASFVMIGGR